MYELWQCFYFETHWLDFTLFDLFPLKSSNTLCWQLKQTIWLLTSFKFKLSLTINSGPLLNSSWQTDSHGLQALICLGTEVLLHSGVWIISQNSTAFPEQVCLRLMQINVHHVFENAASKPVPCSWDSSVRQSGAGIWTPQGLLGRPDQPSLHQNTIKPENVAHVHTNAHIQDRRGAFPSSWHTSRGLKTPSIQNFIRERSQKPPRRRDLYNSLRFIPLNEGQMVHRRIAVGVVDCQILRGYNQDAFGRAQISDGPLKLQRIKCY